MVWALGGASSKALLIIRHMDTMFCVSRLTVEARIIYFEVLLSYRFLNAMNARRSSNIGAGCRVVAGAKKGNRYLYLIGTSYSRNV